MKNKIILKGFAAPFLFFSVGLVSANVSNNVSSNRFGVHNILMILEVIMLIEIYYIVLIISLI
ncbi:hypothetical protein NW066_03830 [Mycoplasmopsis felis]|nr:hypothetical protein [Mycoplasmopsis felis]UWV84724.1 hypothetical protein NW066_03830 [Mycoplasmopsis felis]